MPVHYNQVSSEDEIIKYIGERNSIGIEIYTFEKNFLSPIDIAQKLTNYEGLLKAVNYESVLQNQEMKTIEISGIICGRFSTEIKTLEGLNKEITIIIPMQEYDLIFTIYGLSEEMNKYNNEIENIIESIKIK